MRFAETKTHATVGAQLHVIVAAIRGMLVAAQTCMRLLMVSQHKPPMASAEADVLVQVPFAVDSLLHCTWTKVQNVRLHAFMHTLCIYACISMLQLIHKEH
jgi:hypothetical protein